MVKIESVTVRPDGVTEVRIAGFDIPIHLKAGEQIRYIKVSVHQTQLQHSDGEKTTILMQWGEQPG